MNIGENIKYYRTLNHMEQKDLAQILHISNKTISSWECGRTEPNIGMLETLADVFGVTKSDLIDGASHLSTPTEKTLFDRLMEYSRHLNPQGLEKLFERAEELHRMGYVKEGGQNDD